MPEVTLSSKNQIVIPREARTALGVKAGDKLLISVIDDRAILLRKPERFNDAIRGIGKDLYPGDYLNHERESWD